jgi:hypothetical protein
MTDTQHSAQAEPTALIATILGAKKRFLTTLAILIIANAVLWLDVFRGCNN